MSRQHAAPLLIGKRGAEVLTPLPLGSGPNQISEAELQTLLHSFPAMLPIAEIDPLFADPVPICTELNTLAGAIDSLMVTRSGLPVLIECKLWRNPEARREVVGQILDYAKELSRWTASDLQREVSRRTGRSGNVVLDLVREGGHEIDEAAFNDALTRNLRRGRCLLLIVGDGIREGVEAIAEYLQVHAGLHFTLGLIEMPLFLMPDGSKILTPRVMVRTTVMRREVVAVPTGFEVRESDLATDPGEHPRRSELDQEAHDRLAFLREMLADLELSDPDQLVPRPSPKGYLFLPMPGQPGSTWIYVSVRPSQVGLWLTAVANSTGEQAVSRVVQDWTIVAAELGGSASLREAAPGRFYIADYLDVQPFADGSERLRALQWLRKRVDDFVSVLRPRIASAVRDIISPEA